MRFQFTFEAKPGVKVHEGAYTKIVTRWMTADTVEEALARAETIYPEAIDVDDYTMTFESSDS